MWKAKHSSFETKSEHPRGLTETPYTRAIKEWDNRIGSARAQAHSWRLACCILSAALALAVVGLIILGSKQKVVAHVVEVDSLGAATYRGPVGQGARAPKQIEISDRLTRFIDAIRSVSRDNMVVRRNWHFVYETLTTAGAAQASAWFDESLPFQRLQSESVSVEILNAVMLTKDSWQIDWSERRWDQRGVEVGRPEIWRATLRLSIQPPTDVTKLQKNPFGVYIDEFHWARVRTPEVSG